MRQTAIDTGTYHINRTIQRKFAENVFAQNSNREVFNQVKARKNALGIIGVSWIIEVKQRIDAGLL